MYICRWPGKTDGSGATANAAAGTAGVTVMYNSDTSTVAEAKQMDEMNKGKSSIGLDENVAAGLAALIWIVGVIFYFIEKDSKFVKFYGFQMFILGLVGILGAIPIVGWILSVAILVFVIINTVNAFQGKIYKVPFIGNIAAKQAGLE
jgi:uncharacterized membrane protein